MSLTGLLLGSPSLLSVVVLSLIFIVGLGLFFSGKLGSKPPSKNPFAKDCARPPKPVVVDQSARDKVIKQGFTSNKVPDNLDAIIVGSGIGGLALGAIMAKAGKKVLVLEQHDQAGGCCHSFVEKGFEFDVGIHYVGEMAEGTLTRTIVDQLTEGQLVWESVDEVYDTVAINEGGKSRYYEIKSGSRKVFRDNLVRQFPEEEAAIDKFMAMLKKCKGEFSKTFILKVFPKWLGQILVSTGIIHILTSYFRDGKKTLDHVLDGLTSNKDLKTVLSYCFGDFGTPPDKCCFQILSILMNHFMHGAYYPRGGASEIAFHLVPVIESAGGKCLVRAPVTEIVVNEGGKATGTPPDKCSFNLMAVLMNHFLYGCYYPRGGASEIAFHLIPVIEAAGGKCLVRAPVTEIILDKRGRVSGVVVSKGSNKVTINAAMVVSDAGVYNTAKLLSPNVTPAIKQVTGKEEKGLHVGYGGFSAFVGLNGTAEELQLPRSHTWSFSSNDLAKTFWAYLGRSVSDIYDEAVPLVFISFPSAKDSSWEKRYPGKSVCTLVTIVNYQWFEDWEKERVMHRGEGYESVKDAIAKKMWEHVLQKFPHLKDKVEYFESGSPLSNNYYLGANRGEMYGLDHNKERFSAQAAVALHPTTAVPNLYLTGQDVLSCGFAGALYGALLASCHTLNRNVLLDVMGLKKRLKKQQKNKAN